MCIKLDITTMYIELAPNVLRMPIESTLYPCHSMNIESVSNELSGLHIQNGYNVHAGHIQSAFNDGAIRHSKGTSNAHSQCLFNTHSSCIQCGLQ